MLKKKKKSEYLSKNDAIETYFKFQSHHFYLNIHFFFFFFFFFFLLFYRNIFGILKLLSSRVKKNSPIRQIILKGTIFFPCRKFYPNYYPLTMRKCGNKNNDLFPEQNLITNHQNEINVMFL